MEIKKRIPVSRETTEVAPVRISRRGKAVLALVGTGLAAGGFVAAVDANTPHFHGEHPVTITESTVTGIAEDSVKGASDHIQDTDQRIVDMNPSVFHGKEFVDNDAYGKTIEVPDSVD